MRSWTAALCGAFLAAALAGCGGAPTVTAPTDAKAGPPPGSSPDMLKAKEAKKK